MGDLALASEDLPLPLPRTMGDPALGDLSMPSVPKLPVFRLAYPFKRPLG